MSLSTILQQTGQFPGLSLQIVPLDRSKFADRQYGHRVDNFLSYRFRSSIVQPIEDFSFTFAYTDDTTISQHISEGDIAQLVMTVQGADQLLATGVIDTIEVEVTARGEQVTVIGRNLLSQLEEQHVLTLDGGGYWGANVTPSQVAKNLVVNTRIRNLRQQNLQNVALPIACDPGESKMQVLARYLEPFNALVWQDPDGTMVFGKPNMAQAPSGSIVVNKGRRDANALSIRSTRASTQIPNWIVPIWSSQMNAQVQVSKNQGVPNGAPMPSRLRRLGHRVVKTLVMSDTSQTKSSNAAAIAAICQVIGSPSNWLYAYALRELARENMKELTVQAMMPGHLNEGGTAYRMDSIYTVDFDRDNIYENMYVYEVEYSLDENQGPRTLLLMTKLGTICAGIPYLVGVQTAGAVPAGSLA